MFRASENPMLMRWVHPSLGKHTVEISRHASFIGSHLIGGLAALICMTAYGFLANPPDPIVVAGLGWFTLQVPMAWYLSRTANLAGAHLISAIHLCLLIAYAAAFTGGLSSFLLPWLLVVPVEAAMAGSRRTSAAAFTCAVIVAVALAATAYFGMLPPSRIPAPEPWMYPVGLFSALAYIGALATAIYNYYDSASEEIRRSQSRFRIVAENASDLITAHDRSGQVALICGDPMGVLPIDHEALKGEGFMSRIYLEDRQAFMSALSSARAGKPASVEMRICRPDGSFAWVESRFRPARQLDIASVVAVTRSLDERKRYEQELQDARDEALKLNATKSNLFSNLSHELRTPLNGIAGFADLIDKPGVAEGSQREYAGYIRDSARDLAAALNGLLEVSRIEANGVENAPERLDLTNIVKSACAASLPEARDRKVNLSMMTGSQLPAYVEADPDIAERIVKGAIRAIIRLAGPESHVFINCEQSDGDTSFGLFFADEKLGDSIISFFKGEVSLAEAEIGGFRHGATIDLSIVKALVRHAGVNVALEEAPGHGVKLTISFASVGADNQQKPGPQRQISA